MAASVLAQPVSGVCVRGPGLRCISVSARCSKKQTVQPRVRQDPPEIPGLERITFADRGYFLPWLARPSFPRWRPDWNNPHYYRSPAPQDMPLYKEDEAYVFNPKCRLLGGVKQALWLTKSSLIEGLPQSIRSIYEDPAHTFPNHEELVHNTVANACLWSTTEDQRPREEYCPKLLQGLLHMCRMQSCSYPELSQRSFIENYQLAASWRRESVLYLVRGINGLVMSAKTALEPQASPSDIQVTQQQGLGSLYPLSPAIDLQQVNVYEEKNHLGFKDGFPFRHPHTIYLMDPCSTRARFLPDQLRARMIMTAFGSAVAKAKTLYGEDVKNLEKPVVVQSVATDGQLFHFMVLQLNTLDLESSDGMKNIVWMDGDQALYDTVAGRAKIRRKVVVVPAGVSGLHAETFLKFWSMYLHGAV
ncbi:PREDICTED: 39S ribosomal protein L37, mitochondrial [Nanorana parkeri]|uniref:39S ribosomal protein L37, mitochondrial n=1 Tax=Nanorana parkeri TaxID=125878 RepID=UPI00085467E1|nr:PREDICTED: 39S ribosomal protein L37, mitochondrial [Nanorana parkeri]